MKKPAEPDLTVDEANTGDRSETPEDGSGEGPPVNGDVDSGPGHATRAKEALTAVGLLVLVVTAVIGSNLFGVRDHVFGSARPKPRPAAVSRQAAAPAAKTAEQRKTVLRSQPWWQGVTTLTGDGPMAAPAFDVADGALQWRVMWTCQAGRMVVAAPGRTRPVVDTACPGTGTGYGTSTGSVSLQVQADGPWQMQVEQQVDVPLNEAPSAGMSAPDAVRVATGSFYRVDQTGMGTVTLYRVAGGTYALRFDDFFVTANSELDVRLSGLDEPKTSDQFLGAPSAVVAPLEVTTGSLNFTVPTEVDPTQYRSVVIWCRLINSAYSAATLRPVQ